MTKSLRCLLTKAEDVSKKKYRVCVMNRVGLTGVTPFRKTSSH